MDRTPGTTPDNAAIAQVFGEIADLLEVSGGDGFKIRAYRNAVRAIEYAPDDLATMDAAGTVKEIPGIGKAIAEKIHELVTTGRLEYLENLRASVPPGVLDLTAIPGVGPKLAMRFATELGITGIDDLEAAIKDGRVATMSRVGDKSAAGILQGIEAIRLRNRRAPITEVEPLALDILETLDGMGLLRNLSVAGSLRRRRASIKDVDIIGTADDPAAVMSRFVSLPQVERVLGHGDTKSSIIVTGGLQIDLRLVPHDSWGSLLQHFTGSKEHNVALRELAVKRGLSLSEYGIADIATHTQHKFEDEAAFYEFLGLAWVPPEMRENHGEIAAAQEGILPAPVAREDLAWMASLPPDDDQAGGFARALAADGFQRAGIVTSGPAPVLPGLAVSTVDPSTLLRSEETEPAGPGPGVTLAVTPALALQPWADAAIRHAVDSGAHLLLVLDPSHPAPVPAQVRLLLGAVRRGWARAPVVLNTQPDAFIPA